MGAVSELAMITVRDNATGETFEVLGCMLDETLRAQHRGKPRYEVVEQ